MSQNGRLSDSELAPVAGGTRLRKDVAAAWNAMAAKIYAKEGVKIASNGPASMYRTYAQQVELKNDWTAHGAPQNAATPGTSNHGWGTAVDTNDRALIIKYGPPFGFRTSCSDAPWESWHWHWCGGWSGKDPGPDYRSAVKPPRWFKRFGNKLKQLRDRRRVAKDRRQQAGKALRARLHKAIAKFNAAIKRMAKARHDWTEKHK